MAGNNYTVIVKIGAKEVLDEVKRLSFVEGDIMDSEGHAKHQVFDIAEDGNIDRVITVMDLKFAECVEACYPYSREKVGGDPTLFPVTIPPPPSEICCPASSPTAVVIKGGSGCTCERTYGVVKEHDYQQEGEPLRFDNKFIEQCHYTMKLHVPGEMSQTSLALLTKYIQEYMVDSVLADWLGIVKPDAAPKWEGKADKLTDKIKGALVWRVGRIRNRKMRPFG